MAKYQRFDEVPVWQEAARLYQRVLDLFDETNTPISATFRNQLERAALAVSNCVAEGFDAKGNELVVLLTSAHDAAAEVQSMVTIVSERPKLARVREPLLQIRNCAESCARQLAGWRYVVQNPGKRSASEPRDAGRPAGGRPEGAPVRAGVPSGHGG